MILIVKLIGVYLITLGIVIFLKPPFMRRFVSFFMKNKRIYLAGILRISIGIVFLLTVSQSRLPAVMLILGVLTLAGGIALFVLKQHSIRSMATWIERLQARYVRLWAITAAAIGALIIYSV